MSYTPIIWVGILAWSGIWPARISLKSSVQNCARNVRPFLHTVFSCQTVPAMSGHFCTQHFLGLRVKLGPDWSLADSCQFVPSAFLSGSILFQPQDTIGIVTVVSRKSLHILHAACRPASRAIDSATAVSLRSAEKAQQPQTFHGVSHPTV